jgi:hypothetical protein
MEKADFGVLRVKEKKKERDRRHTTGTSSDAADPKYLWQNIKRSEWEEEGNGLEDGRSIKWWS